MPDRRLDVAGTDEHSLVLQEEDDDLAILVVAVQEQLRKANFEDFSNMMDACRHEDVLG